MYKCNHKNNLKSTTEVKEVSKRIGIGKGSIEDPTDFDKWNEEIGVCKIICADLHIPTVRLFYIPDIDISRQPFLFLKQDTHPSIRLSFHFCILPPHNECGRSDSEYC